MNEKEWKTKDGAFPQLFPPNIAIQPVKLESSYASFDKCHYLTKSKDIVLLHTTGHISVALIGQNKAIYLFGGDVAYTKERLHNKVFSATIKNLKENKESCEKVLELTKEQHVIFLPTHDSESALQLTKE